MFNGNIHYFYGHVTMFNSKLLVITRLAIFPYFPDETAMDPHGSKTSKALADALDGIHPRTRGGVEDQIRGAFEGG